MKEAKINIEASINIFINGSGKNKGKNPKERYASFDYCYNYFYSFYKNEQLRELVSDENIQKSCLHLGFYLASWGMYRGSSFLLERSSAFLKDLVISISKMNPKLWEIDVDSYTDDNIELLLDCKLQIVNALGADYKPSDTLITKIMLGVFANIPAFDKYFGDGFDIRTFNKKSLIKIKDFYDNNKAIIDGYKFYTYDFLTAKETNISYTKAKLIDMCGFIAVGA